MKKTLLLISVVLAASLSHAASILPSMENGFEKQNKRLGYYSQANSTSGLTKISNFENVLKNWASTAEANQWYWDTGGWLTGGYNPAAGSAPSAINSNSVSIISNSDAGGTSFGLVLDKVGLQAAGIHTGLSTGTTTLTLSYNSGWNNWCSLSLLNADGSLTLLKDLAGVGSKNMEETLNNSDLTDGAKLVVALGATNPWSGSAQSNIENIQLLGTQAVPEPATASLGLLGLATLLMRRRRAAC